MKLALAPIDGFTDCAFREVAARYGRPDLMFTEFVNCRGLISAMDKLIEILRYTERQRPIIAQLFGRMPKYFYEASLVACELGFDGIDINMGCPAKNIASKGGGAALIKEPQLSVKIVEAVKTAVADYQRGKSQPIDLVKSKVRDWRVEVDKQRKITVSVKTRTGFDEDTVEEWIGILSKTGSDFITLHARTFKQKFRGKADWTAIKRASQIVKVDLIGNGDVGNLQDAKAMLEQTGCSGVMIGRAAIGRPWIFNSEMAFDQDLNMIKTIAFEHASLFAEFRGEARFHELRKHLVKYFNSFDGAKSLRKQVTAVNDLADLKKVFSM